MQRFVHKTFTFLRYNTPDFLQPKAQDLVIIDSAAIPRGNTFLEEQTT